VQNAFSGSAFKLVRRALDDDAVSSDELDAIERLIADVKKRRAT